MITIELGNTEYYNNETNQFEYDEGGVVDFEYSLKVVYEWEGKWRKPFLKGGHTEQELVDFYMAMAFSQFDKKHLTIDVMQILAEYVSDTSTATTFTSTQDKQSGTKSNNKSKTYTSEELYALMFSAGVPIEFENRNLNRLLTILKIIGSHNDPPKKMSKQDIFKQNASLNAQRKEQLKTKG